MSVYMYVWSESGCARVQHDIVQWTECSHILYRLWRLAKRNTVTSSQQYWSSLWLMPLHLGTMLSVEHFWLHRDCSYSNKILSSPTFFCVFHTNILCYSEFSDLQFQRWKKFSSIYWVQFILNSNYVWLLICFLTMFSIQITNKRSNVPQRSDTIAALLTYT